MEKIVAKCLRAVGDSRLALHFAIAAHYPENAPVSWNRGGNVCHGHVLRVRGDRLMVVNEYSGRDYWIDIHEVL